MGLRELKERWDQSGRMIKAWQAEGEEIWQIMTTRNFQWDNYNKLVKWINQDISLLLEWEAVSSLLWVCCAEELWSALSEAPFFISEDYANKKMQKINDKIFRMTSKRVARDSYKKYITLKILDELLKISSSEEFGDRHYKIWDIEINSFEDLQEYRKKLEDLHESTYNYDVPLLKETIDYAEKRWFVVPIYW